MSKSRKEKSFTMYNKNIILLLLASFFYMASTMMTMPIIAGFAGNLGASAAFMGIVAGAMNLISLIVHPIIGHIIDLHSKYKLTLIGAIFLVSASCGYLIVDDSFYLLLCRLINGLGFACCSISLSTWLADLIPKNKIGFGMGLYGTMNALAMAIAPALGLFLFQHLGYSATFITACLFSFAVILSCIDVNNHDIPAKQSQAKSSWKIIDNKIVPLAIIIMLFTIPYCATQAFIVTYIQVQNISATASLFFPVYAIVLLIIRLALKPLFDTGAFLYFLISSSLCAIIAIISLANLNGNILLLIAAIGMAGGSGVMCSVCQASAIKKVSATNRGLANSTYYLGIDLGMALGPIIGGFIYNHFSMEYFYPLFLLTVPFIWLAYFWDFRTQK